MTVLAAHPSLLLLFLAWGLALWAGIVGESGACLSICGAAAVFLFSIQ